MLRRRIKHASTRTERHGVPRAVVPIMAVQTLLIVLAGCGGNEARSATVRLSAVAPVETPVPAPSLRVLPDAPTLDVVGERTRWRLYFDHVEWPEEMPLLRDPGYTEDWRERPEGQFIALIIHVENLGPDIPPITLDLAEALHLGDGSGRSWPFLRAASAAYAERLLGVPRAPYFAYLQPGRAVPFAFVFDVPSDADEFVLIANGTESIPLP